MKNLPVDELHSAARRYAEAVASLDPVQIRATELRLHEAAVEFDKTTKG